MLLVIAPLQTEHVVAVGIKYFPPCITCVGVITEVPSSINPVNPESSAYLSAAFTPSLFEWIQLPVESVSAPVFVLAPWNSFVLANLIVLEPTIVPVAIILPEAVMWPPAPPI